MFFDAKMFTLNRASHHQDDAVTALWSQLWAFLGWYNAVQLVPRFETKEPETAREGQVSLGVCLVACCRKIAFLACGSTLVVYGYQVVKSEVLL